MNLSREMDIPGHRVAVGCGGPLDLPQWVREADLTLLTAREREILSALGDCLPNTGIARRCGISERTVKKHVTSIFVKLAISSRAEAAVMATYRKGELIGGWCPSGH
ncbi:helix-turn-helix domain-containing protein [Streptomyces sp. JNUCC 64]